MLSVLKAIFGAPDILKTGAKLLDEAVYTKQEQSEDERAFALRVKNQQAAQIIAFMEATTGQNLARRYLAFAIVGVYLGVLVLGFLMIFAAAFVDEPALSAKLNQAGEAGHDILSELKVQFGLIMSFYFGSPLLKTVMDNRRATKSPEAP